MNNPERIGVFGGTFDPIHNAHLDIARAAREQARLDRVIFVVSARPPHKSGDTFASAEDRYAMLEAAVASDDDGFEPSRIEMDREGPSYTVDTLRALARLHVGAALFLIIGLDSLLDLPKWKDPQGILALARVLAVPRPGLAKTIPAAFEGRYDLIRFRETLVSSTEVRERILAGSVFGDLVPPLVEEMIRTRRLYHVSG